MNSPAGEVYGFLCLWWRRVSGLLLLLLLGGARAPSGCGWRAASVAAANSSASTAARSAHLHAPAICDKADTVAKGAGKHEQRYEWRQFQQIADYSRTPGTAQHAAPHAR